MRVVWFGFGWVNVGMGGLGAVLPGLPSVVFFIVAAYSFSRSSPRFERWVLGLPGIGPMVADYRAGLGMARRAKFVAIASVVVFGSISAIVAYQRPWLSALIAVLCFVGILTIVFAVPLRERVLLERARERATRGTDPADGIVVVGVLVSTAETPGSAGDASGSSSRIPRDATGGG